VWLLQAAAEQVHDQQIELEASTAAATVAW
jgi:hypothetical protein